MSGKPLLKTQGTLGEKLRMLCMQRRAARYIKAQSSDILIPFATLNPFIGWRVVETMGLLRLTRTLQPSMRQVRQLESWQRTYVLTVHTNWFRWPQVRH